MEKNKCFFTMRDIRQAVEDVGGHWFDKDTMRFFKSRVLPTVYKGQYFISSEKENWNDKRKYTIRKIDLATHSIETVGEFMGFNSPGTARTEIKRLPSP